jgi:hypothetical protein
MTTPQRSILALSTLAFVLVLAACGTTVGAPTAQPTTSPDPSVAPSEQPADPSEPAGEERTVDGTLTVAEMAFSGPGATIQEALDAGPTGDELPTLVNGVLFRDTDGAIYLATSVSDADAPTFDGPMLLVLGMDNEGPSWDMANAEIINLTEANGIVFKDDAQVLGFLAIP